MTHFRGTVQGRRGPATRLGDMNTGLSVEAQSWQGKIVVGLYTVNHPEYGLTDMARVERRSHPSDNYIETLYDGPVSQIGRAHV